MSEIKGYEVFRVDIGRVAEFDGRIAILVGNTEEDRFARVHEGTPKSFYHGRMKIIPSKKGDFPSIGDG